MWQISCFISVWKYLAFFLKVLCSLGLYNWVLSCKRHRRISASDFQGKLVFSSLSEHARIANRFIINKYIALFCFQISFNYILLLSRLTILLTSYLIFCGLNNEIWFVHSVCVIVAFVFRDVNVQSFQRSAENGTHFNTPLSLRVSVQ